MYLHKFYYTVFFIFLFFICGCDKSNCKDIVCGTNQQCLDSQCYCIEGYEGSTCSDYAADKYIGNYYVNLTCQPNNPPIVGNSSIISDYSPISELQFTNFLGSGLTAYAYISYDGNYFRFEDQSLGSSGTRVIGEGWYEAYNSTQRIKIDVQYTINGIVNYCTIFYY